MQFRALKDVTLKVSFSTQENELVPVKRCHGFTSYPYGEATLLSLTCFGGLGHLIARVLHGFTSAFSSPS